MYHMCCVFVKYSLPLFHWYRPSTQCAGIMKASSSCAVTQTAAWRCGTSETLPSHSKSPSLMVRYTTIIYYCFVKQTKIYILYYYQVGKTGLFGCCLILQEEIKQCGKKIFSLLFILVLRYNKHKAKAPTLVGFAYWQGIPTSDLISGDK